MSVDPERILITVSQVTGVGRWFLRYGGNRPRFVQARAVALLTLRRAGLSWRRCAAALQHAPSSLYSLARTYQDDEHVLADVWRCSEIHGLQNEPSNAEAQA